MGSTSIRVWSLQLFSCGCAYGYGQYDMTFQVAAFLLDAASHCSIQPVKIPSFFTNYAPHKIGVHYTLAALMQP